MDDPRTTLDPQMRLVLDAAEQARTGLPAFHQQSAPEVRAWQARVFIPFWNRPVLPLARVEDLNLPGPAGPLCVRHYDPGLPPPAPAVLYLHGGGWTIGNLDTHDALCRRLAFLGARRVVAVDYRLGPEHRFPACLDDAAAALAFVLEQGGALGLDTETLVLAGDSAGAHLALAVTMERRNRGASLPAMLVLIYGAYRYLIEGPSWDAFGDPYFLLSREDTAWFWRNLLPEDYVAGSDPRVEPLLGAMHGLPPAFVVACSHDPLIEDSELLVAAIRAAGGEATLETWPGVTHGAAQFSQAVDAVILGLERIARRLRPQRR